MTLMRTSMDCIRIIVEHTAIVFERTTAELLGRSRRQPIAEARQAAMWAVRKRHPSISLMDIGDAIGGRHYTTVMHALAAVELRATHDPAYAARLRQLLHRIGATKTDAAHPTLVRPPHSRPWWQHPTEKQCIS